MTRYADPETLIAGWLHTSTGVKAWADPKLPGNERFLAPIAHIQRVPDAADMPLSLDAAQLAVDVYAAAADHARSTADVIRAAMTLQLPLTTFPSGAFVKAVYGGTPTWTPDPVVYRRTAPYRVILPGVRS